LTNRGDRFFLEKAMNTKQKISTIDMSPVGGRQDLNNVFLWTLTP